jgi:hypothetical protein
MSNPRISSVILYIIAALSLLVILFFYAGPKLVGNFDELEARYEEVTTGGDMDVTDQAPAAETAVADTTMADSTALADEGESMDAEPDSAAAPMIQEEELPLEAAAEVEIVDLKDHFSSWELMVLNRTDYALIWAYILFILTAIAAVVFPLFTVVTNVKALVRTLAIFAGAAVLILLSYFVFASDTPIEILGYAGTDNRDPVTLKWVGTGLFSTYILFGMAILSILYSEIASMFK